ncbi:hypothetical protein [Nonomuraea jabiensis]|uniref:hypothetical protein n=1 Tax=Nonomuraea jabiensis TaxID=882448 RepID=UPI003D70ACE8
MLAAGVDLKVVQETLGHVSSTFTRDTYTSVYPEVARTADSPGACLFALNGYAQTVSRSILGLCCERGREDRCEKQRIFYLLVANGLLGKTSQLGRLLTVHKAITDRRRCTDV